MGSQIISILKQGVWASLTGGWFYDQRQSHFANVFHLYVWLFLFGSPLCIQLFGKQLFKEDNRSHYLLWMIYCFVIAILFTAVKLFNEYLHRLFDSGKFVVDDNLDINGSLNEADAGTAGDFESAAEQFVKLGSNRNEETIHDDDISRINCFDRKTLSNETREDIELSVLKFDTSHKDELEEQPIASCSSDYRTRDSKMEGKINLEIDFHHRNSSDGSIDGSFFDINPEQRELLVKKKSNNLSKKKEISAKHIVTNSKKQELKLESISLHSNAVSPTDVRLNSMNEATRLAQKTRIGVDSGDMQSFSSELIGRNELYSDLGFLAQDPSVLRNRNMASSSGNDQQSARSRFAGRRAKSELETADYSNGGGDPTKQTCNIPSHPVSLEQLGIKCVTGSDSTDSKRRKERSENPSLAGDLESVPERVDLKTTAVQQESQTDLKTEISIQSSCGSLLTNQHKQSTIEMDNASMMNLLPSEHSLKMKKNKSQSNKKNLLGSDVDWKLTSADVSSSSPSPLKSLSSLSNVSYTDSELTPEHHQQSDMKANQPILKKMPTTSSTNSASSATQEAKSIASSSFRPRSKSVSIKYYSNKKKHSSSSKRRCNKTKSTGTSNRKNEIPRVQRHQDVGEIKRKKVTKLNGRKLDAYRSSTKPDQIVTKTTVAEQLDKVRTTASSPYTANEIDYDKIMNMASTSSGIGGGTVANPIASSSTTLTSEGPPAYLLAQILATPGTHLAKSHDDTNVGAVHCFQDERGNWLTYIFDEHSIGTAQDLFNKTKCHLFNKIKSNDSNKQDLQLIPSSISSSSSSSAGSHFKPVQTIQKISTTSFISQHQRNASSTTDENGSNQLAPFLTQSSNSLFDNPFPVVSLLQYRDSQRSEMTSNIYSLHNQFPDSLSTAANGNSVLNDLYSPMQPCEQNFAGDSRVKKLKQHYKLPILPCFKWKHIKIRINRLNLLLLLDRSGSHFDLIVSIMLAVLVSTTSSIMIEKQLFHDLQLFFFCFVVASCQYTLLKSVQPDAASSTHGFNRIIIFSRPVYFLLIGCIILLCGHYREQQLHWNLNVYGVNLMHPTYVEFVEHRAKQFILIFPLVFSFGFLPQINTFLMYFLEQLDMHIFGASAATTGLSSAVYSFTKSLLSTAILYIFALISLSFSFTNKQWSVFTFNDYNSLFSVFCGFLVFFAYHLSRSSSDPTVLWKIVKKWFVAKRACRLCSSNRRQTAADVERALDQCEVQRLNPEEEGGTDGGGGGDHADFKEEDDEDTKSEFEDPLPGQLEATIRLRLENDFICGIFIVILVFAVHVSTIFTVQPYVENSVRTMAIGLGFLLHYFLPHFRKELPWLCFSSPILKSKEYDLFEVKDECKLMWFERVQAVLWLIEKNLVYPLVFLSAITVDTPQLIKQFGFPLGTAVMVVCALKCIRSTYNDSNSNFATLLFTQLLFQFDLAGIREPFLLNYFLMRIAHSKLIELMLKLQFVITYIAPWQITWGSAFHAFAQPFSVPHSGLLFAQALLASLISAPLQPLLGSAIFLLSYVRPTRFWEKEYNTRRLDSGNSRLQAQLEAGGSDDNNLNSVFYEHLSRRLQACLYGDVALGRWGTVEQGDCFVLASDKLNALLHVIALGNGVLTFQLRGLEFRGTYCQQREVEAISEWVNEDDGCCCCEPGHLPGLLSLNAAFNQRWLAWQVVRSKYVLQAYSISDYMAMPMVHQYDMRKALLSYYVRCVCYYAATNKRLRHWLRNPRVRAHLTQYAAQSNSVDLDAAFSAAVHEDYDLRAGGISRSSFASTYGKWIRHCARNRNHNRHTGEHSINTTAAATSVGSTSLNSGSIGPTPSERNVPLNSEEEELLVSLCYALSLVARRSLNAASHCAATGSVELLLHGLHALFKGDFRLGAPRDEWVFEDMQLLRKVIAPAVRMSLKLHQDHFTSTDEYEDDQCLLLAIRTYEKNLVISHEADPLWRKAILANVDSLLTLRHVFDDGSDQYKVIMLGKRHLSFRLIKVNRECVRGLWAGQQQELVFLRNCNAERGSIQNARQSLRNIINSSCDQPIGYPIYVSPLLSSYAEGNAHWIKATGSPLSFQLLGSAIRAVFTRVRRRCEQACTSRALRVNQTIQMDRLCSTGSVGISGTNASQATGSGTGLTVSNNAGGHSSLTNWRSRSINTVPLYAFDRPPEGPNKSLHTADPEQQCHVLLKRNRSASSGHHVQLSKQVRRAEQCESLDQPIAGSSKITSTTITNTNATTTIVDCSTSKGKVDQV